MSYMDCLGCWFFQKIYRRVIATMNLYRIIVTEKKGFAPMLQGGANNAKSEPLVVVCVIRHCGYLEKCPLFASWRRMEGKGKGTKGEGQEADQCPSYSTSTEGQCDSRWSWAQIVLQLKPQQVWSGRPWGTMQERMAPMLSQRVLCSTPSVGASRWQEELTVQAHLWPCG